MDVLIGIILLLIGIPLLIGGGEILVRGASALAGRIGVSPLIIGLTIVAFGTSAPELAVNVAAAIKDQTDISFGNIIGSNIANIGLIVGITALIRPIAIERTIIIREIPMMLLATAVVIVLACDTLFDIERNAPAGTGVVTTTVNLITGGDGIVLLMIFGVFIYYNISDAARQRRSEILAPLPDETETKTDQPDEKTQTSLFVASLLTLGGLIGVAGGGELTVQGAVRLAAVLGMPNEIIGLTIVAIGTSLPELVTSITAVYRNQTDIGIGNIVGSNIFNLLFILGITPTFRAVPVPDGGWSDLVVMGGLSLILLPICISNQRKIMRFEAAVLVLTYFGYMGWRVFG